MRRFAPVLAAALVCAPAAEAELTFERANGETTATGSPRVWCGPWSADVATPALHVGTRSWHLGVVRADLRRGHAFTFPHSFVFDHPTGAELFLADGRNELSTAGDDAGGRLFFRRVSCRPGRRLVFEADVILDSEVAGPSVRMHGTFRGRVGRRTWPIP
ncbi:MAG: hypothetical protein ACJ762_18605 [Solirubrobacteraceae bacterium]